MLNSLANGIAYMAYNRMLSGQETKADIMAYNKGVIAGLTMLFLNVEEEIEDCKEFVKNYKEEADGNETV